ncbi:hypothetical protein BGK37_05065 [Pasteurella multocida]|nr:hypothetical protein BGK37_05065 [Pasteurella multocida]
MIKLRTDQEIAKQAIIEEFKKSNRATIVQACGTGKTIVSIKTISSLISGDDKVVIFAPTLLLINQLLNDWIRETDLPITSYSIICSNKKTGIIDDIQCVEETSVPVFNTQEEIINSIKKDGIQIIFCTYKSSKLLEGLHFQYGIFDEAHRTAGESDREYSFAVNENCVNIDKRLFMTATPKVKSVDNKEYLSMDDTDDYGETCFTLSFRQAIEMDLICPYKILLTVITDKELNSDDFKQIQHNDIRKRANAIALQKCINDYKIKKIITFHETIEDAKDHEVLFNKNISSVRSFHISGRLSQLVRKSILKKFKDSECGIITNARCLSEGIDVPDVDAVAFMNPKTSVIDIVQSIGRSMRKYDGKEVGYIILPVYSSHENISMSKSVFNNLFNVLLAISEVDECLKEEIVSCKFKGKFQWGKWIDFIYDDSITKERLMRSIEVISSDLLIVPFEVRVQQFLQYKEEYGTPIISKKEKTLSRWGDFIKALYRQNRLSKEREKRLLEVGFVFDKNEYIFNRYFVKYKEYKENGYHDYDIPDEKIKRWINKTKEACKSRNYKKRTELLKSIGANFTSKLEIWFSHFEKAKEVCESVGGILNVSKKYNPKTYGWLRAQKRNYEKLGEERVRKLEEIEFSSFIKKTDETYKKQKGERAKK